MMKSRMRFILALDGSDRSRDTVAYACRMLDPEMSEVVLFHVQIKIPEAYWDFSSQPNLDYKLKGAKSWSAQQELNMQTFMQQAQDAFIEAGFIPDRVWIKIQERAEGVSRDIWAESRSDYSGLIMGRRGFTRLGNLALGSSAAKLIEALSDMPLILVGRKTEPGRILLALDRSENALRAAQFAARALNGSSAEILLFHVIRKVDGQDQALKEDAHTRLTAEKEAIQETFRKVEYLLTRAGVPDERIHQRIVTGRVSRAKAIVDEAKKCDWPSIILGRRGLSSPAQFPMGRVARKVVNLARGRAVWLVN